MNIRVLAAVATSFLLVSPSFAATTYYVAHLPKSKACVIVTAKPDGKTMVMVGKAGYDTTTKASAAMQAASDCKV